jgi:hypothetical protein
MQFSKVIITYLDDTPKETWEDALVNAVHGWLIITTANTASYVPSHNVKHCLCAFSH